MEQLHKFWAVYDGETIVGTYYCSIEAIKDNAAGLSYIEGKANGAFQKVVGGKIVDKTPEEIEEDNPPFPEVPYEQQTAEITNEQWQAVLDRLTILEGKK